MAGKCLVIVTGQLKFLKVFIMTRLVLESEALCGALECIWYCHFISILDVAFLTPAHKGWGNSRLLCHLSGSGI